MVKIKLLDTFSWVGGFHLALEQSIWKENIECIWFSEIDKFAKQVYQKHFPNIPDLWDITEIDINNLPDFDLLTWWFPCQDVSVAGKQDLSGGRTILVEHLLQILEKKKPKYFVFENVKWLMSKKFTEFREMIFSRINNAWYNLYCSTLNTKNFWLPQNRERVFIVWTYWTETYYNFPKWQELTTFLKDILEEEVEEKYFYQTERLGQNFWKNYIQWDMSWKWYKSQQDRAYYENGFMWTLASSNWSNKNNVYVNWKIRRTTPIEWERLQGYPDNWTEWITNNKRKEKMWNAISIPVVKAIFDNLIIF